MLDSGRGVSPCKLAHSLLPPVLSNMSGLASTWNSANPARLLYFGRSLGKQRQAAFILAEAAHWRCIARTKKVVLLPASACLQIHQHRHAADGSDSQPGEAVPPPVRHAQLFPTGQQTMARF